MSYQLHNYFRFLLFSSSPYSTASLLKEHAQLLILPSLWASHYLHLSNLNLRRFYPLTQGRKWLPRPQIPCLAPPQSLIPSKTSVIVQIGHLSLASTFSSILTFFFLSNFKCLLRSASPLHLPSQIRYLKERCLLLHLRYHLFISETHCNMVSDTISPKKKKKCLTTVASTLDAFQLLP